MSSRLLYMYATTSLLVFRGDFPILITIYLIVLSLRTNGTQNDLMTYRSASRANIPSLWACYHCNAGTNYGLVGTQKIYPKVQGSFMKWINILIVNYKYVNINTSNISLMIFDVPIWWLEYCNLFKPI